MTALCVLHVLLALVLAPLLPGVINRVKARFAGRRGKPLLQTYFDLAKLLRKGTVYSRTAAGLIQAGPVVSLAAGLAALALLPFGGAPALVSFQGDFILLAYVLALGRFFTMAAALDTGSSFEGMGASREALYSALAEPALFLALLALSRHAGALSLSAFLAPPSGESLLEIAPVAAMTAVTLFIVLLAENSRIPVDDPNTHLELTMIHEVMVLDHGGPDLAFIEYGAALKLWLFAALATGLFIPADWPAGWPPLLGTVAGLAGQFLLAGLVGVAESGMARLRLTRVPRLLSAASAFSAVSLVLLLR